MNFKLTTFAFIAACATANIAHACQTTVMGGCVQEPTHDTSSHMKSQIVNKIEAPKPVVATQTGNENKTKLGSKKANSANLVQAAAKAVIK